MLLPKNSISLNLKVDGSLPHCCGYYFLRRVFVSLSVDPRGTFENIVLLRLIVNSEMIFKMYLHFKLFITVLLTAHTLHLTTAQDTPNYHIEEENNFPCSHFDSVNIEDGVRNPDGTITHNGITYPQDHIKEYEHTYVNHTTKVSAPKHMRGCICKHRICIQSCCPQGEHIFNFQCEKGPTVNSFDVQIQQNGATINHNLMNDAEYAVTYIKKCAGILLEPDQGEAWSLKREGNNVVINVEDDSSYDSSKFCLAYNHTTMIAITCYEAPITAQFRSFPIGMTLSVVFLLATFIVYAIIRELRTTLHGKCLMCYVLCLSIGYAFLAAILFNAGNTLLPGLCLSIGFIIYASFLSSFLWLAVISYDIWWTFGKGGGQTEGRFLKYNFFAWGTATAFLIFAIIMQFSSSFPDGMRPSFENKCWFGHRMAEFYYMYLPLIIIVIFNLTFFIATAIKIRQAQKQASNLMRGDSQRHSKAQTQRDTLCLYFRLFIIMGVTWTMEAISWFFPNQPLAFIIFDIVNCMQGVLIFFLFVCKRRVRNLMVKRCTSARITSDLASNQTNISQVPMQSMESAPLASTTTDDDNRI